MGYGVRLLLKINIKTKGYSLSHVIFEPIEGVFGNGSWVEVEVDIHCSRAKEKERQQHLLQVPAEASDEGIVVSANEDEPGLSKEADFSAVETIGRLKANGSVAPQERSHSVIEVAADAPLRKPEGYFAAPVQPDPDDQFIIPSELEEEVKEIMKHHQEQQQQQHKTEVFLCLEQEENTT
ncbi:PH domain leucine-rich repeat-containing protein phosphatase 1-like [Apodemus sylvaticus]|uniref:PH domain leucine-rich repeat-containing protein phosphatase 1-like n=1 Tax=Apodemus sylvaticus TaxID=10129 RepID=UPI0022432924|nr:PH domain leucine-rich repeat-containing protein phosphatase 1-like [Apodemus sylvaticus]